MDEDNSNPDRLLSEPSDFPTQPHDGTGNMSSGAPGDDASVTNGDAAPSAPAAPPPAQVDPNAKIVHDVVNSEVRATSRHTTSIRS
jgi:hypothetical protein